MLIGKEIPWTFQWAQEHLHFVISCLRKTQLKIYTPLKRKKNANIFAFSHICILCFHNCIEYKESPKNLERHILANGPHLVSPQEAQKGTKTQNEATVEQYFWSLIDCHPVCSTLELDLSFLEESAILFVNPIKPSVQHQ